MIEAAAFLSKHPVRIEVGQDDTDLPQPPAKSTHDVLAQSALGHKAAGLVEEQNPYFAGAGTGGDHPQRLAQAHFGRIDGEAEETDKSTRSKGRRQRYRQQARKPRQGGFGYRGRPSSVASVADPLDEDACREAGLTLLDAAARPRQALVDRLLAKGYDPLVVERVVSRLEELGLVDDLSYAQSFLRYCLRRNLGERGCLQEMVRKGLTRSTAEEVVTQAAQEGLFVDAAYELGRKVAAKTRGLDVSVRQRRLWSAGGRKGHDPGVLKQVAGDVFQDEAA
ncbi:hypothetical protein KIM372_10780 [Bombiscardovia nodaiensis]|uniref:RecX first three-helical domain-containing protein n=1 Tax=Bombiscardovia nodaiensis TaxID=2932181 RepID=A0ABM8B8F9_9BIFI|nr:hypothetical protein KIM372_10780 [Bombiscardovia nodaiensis]